MLKKDIKLVIFDMDGLLVDSESVYSQGWLEGIKKHNLDLPKDIVYKMNGRSPKHNTDLLNSYIQNEKLVQQVRNVRQNYFFEELERGNVSLKPFAKELLLQLKKHNYQTALATTSASNNALKILNYHNILSLFDYSIFGDQVEEVKPAPDLYLNILDQADISHEATIILEDSLTGALAGKNANVNVILIPDPLYTDISTIDDNNIVAVHDHLGETYQYFF